MLTLWGFFSAFLTSALPSCTCSTKYSNFPIGMFLTPASFKYMQLFILACLKKWTIATLIMACDKQKIKILWTRTQTHKSVNFYVAPFYLHCIYLFDDLVDLSATVCMLESLQKAVQPIWKGGVNMGLRSSF